MTRTTTLFIVLALSLSANLPAHAAGMDTSNMNMDSSSQAAETEAVGVVDDINTAKGIVTISHEPIKSLGWPAMTMDFVVQDKKMLSKIAKGKKIQFTFIEHRGNYLITKIK